MLFNSLSFFVFFPIVTTLYFVLPQRARWALLLAASCIFYMAFVPSYILILAFTIVVDYFAGLLIARSAGRSRTLWLSASVVTNVGVLAVFKYYNFFVRNLMLLGMHFGTDVHLPYLKMLLPIGLSFHTFQAMSYTIEVYRGKQEPERHFGIYALYVMFYPQLVAGPIERPQNLLWQFRRHFDFDYDRVVSGLQRMAWGMLKKTVIADRLAMEVDRVYNAPHGFRGFALVNATLFFAFQIYYDFSGYTDIALGAAEVMGFKLMQNFRTPYFSTSLAEFWTRWHISLSTWFRDYLYIPLGGNRVGLARNLLNLMIVFVVSGLWHGASWTFAIWGAIHGTMVVLERLTRDIRARTGNRLQMSKRLRDLSGWFTTFGICVVAWIFFRANTTSDAFYIVSHLGSGWSADMRSIVHGVVPQGSARAIGLRYLLIALMVGIERWDNSVGVFNWLRKRRPIYRYAAYFALVYSCLLLNEAHHQFIYFQF